ncbi:hypothetical protein KY290_008015 [Solanum tuberosum]|uniref:Uncharacterized protein n=1 Tax=Solanum tuberosum TaxID=4113 RepID=A0ABQ7W7D0_SOLTU|nr:hypothetical protein KY290_008015 [Solanum tuberosum]
MVSLLKSQFLSVLRGIPSTPPTHWISANGMLCSDFHLFQAESICTSPRISLRCSISVVFDPLYQWHFPQYLSEFDYCSALL